jgi:hypothetical protein
MTKTVVIHQPDFAPYLGFFHRFLHADEFIVLDHVQFVTGTSRSWTHRDKIKTAAGEQWITLSTARAPLGTPINAIELSTTVDWRRKNLDLLIQNYRKASYFGLVFPAIEQAYDNPPTLMADFNMRFVQLLMDMLDVTLPWRRSADMQPAGASNELLIDLLTKVGATRYLSGTGARAYMEPDKFEKAGIEVIWQDFQHPVYPQLYGPFIPYLSSLDALFNCGIERTRKLLRGLP